MSVLVENIQKLNDEKNIQNKLNNAIDNNKHFVFDAGAGAGKTYALIESLKYIIKTYGEKLVKKNQHVLCITYTNAAADNIKLNFGNSDIVKVSTIHERIWGLICLHQEALVLEHKIKVKNELKKLNDKFNSGTAEKWLNNESSNKEKFIEYFCEPDAKDLFYTSTQPAIDFKNIFLECGYDLNRNKGKFEESVKYIYEKENLTTCLALIESGEYKQVKYNPNFNSDRLHYMRISHDTLLEYGLALCKKYSLLRRIIVDSYPYILIDEYQDTDTKVVQLMSELAHQNENSKALLIGYYGDKIQSIYDKGVSGELNKYHDKLLRIEKKYNRRSRNEVINISNKLRNDGLSQESIYDNNIGGSFSFYQLDSQRPSDSLKLVSEFIKEKCSDNSNNEVHCLVLKNEMLAELSGFKDFFSYFKGFFFHDDQKDKLISKDLNKLDDIILVIFKLINFYQLIAKKNKTLEELLPKEQIDISMLEAQEYVGELATLIDDEIQTFEDYLTKIFYLYHHGSSTYKRKLNEFFSFNNFTYSLDSFRQLLNNKLPTRGSIKKEEIRIEQIDKALKLNLVKFITWYEFVNDSSTDTIKFHTYHSTKGLEYHNVIILMENSFAKNKNYFPDFFKELNNIEFQKRRNLLYVACSRAISHMRILYLDPIDSFNDGVTQLFGEVKKFKYSEQDNNTIDI